MEHVPAKFYKANANTYYMLRDNKDEVRYIVRDGGSISMRYINKKYPEATGDEIQFKNLPVEIQKHCIKIFSDTTDLSNPLSEKAKKFIGKKIGILNREGYKQPQSSAIAYSMARKKGFHVPIKNPSENDRYKTPLRKNIMIKVDKSVIETLIMKLDKVLAFGSHKITDILSIRNNLEQTFFGKLKPVHAILNSTYLINYIEQLKDCKTLRWGDKFDDTVDEAVLYIENIFRGIFIKNPMSKDYKKLIERELESLRTELKFSRDKSFAGVSKRERLNNRILEIKKALETNIHPHEHTKGHKQLFPSQYNPAPLRKNKKQNNFTLSEGLYGIISNDSYLYTLIYRGNGSLTGKKEGYDLSVFDNQPDSLYIIDMSKVDDKTTMRHINIPNKYQPSETGYRFYTGTLETYLNETMKMGIPIFKLGVLRQHLKTKNPIVAKKDLKGQVELPEGNLFENVYNKEDNPIPFVLWGKKKEDLQDWQESVIVETSDKEKLKKAFKWAKENGFTNLRVTQLDMTVPPDFMSTINNPLSDLITKTDEEILWDIVLNGFADRTEIYYEYGSDKSIDIIFPKYHKELNKKFLRWYCYALWTEEQGFRHVEVISNKKELEDFLNDMGVNKTNNPIKGKSIPKESGMSFNLPIDEAGEIPLSFMGDLYEAEILSVKKGKPIKYLFKGGQHKNSKVWESKNKDVIIIFPVNLKGVI